ncbi:MAG: hypothetical protein M3Y21_06135 [Candidatus Eremiobacteraeota bacterium]|nr:hypothetical protein [Candidatus Eremiobacteraeota bacterium]
MTTWKAPVLGLELPTFLTEQRFEAIVILSEDSLSESAVDGRAMSKKLELPDQACTSPKASAGQSLY